MIQRRKCGETPPFQTNLRIWTELITTEYHSRPHHGAITKGRGLRNRRPRSRALFCTTSWKEPARRRPIIVNDDSTLIVVKTREATDILLERPAPGNRHGEQKRVETGVVEAFTAEALAGFGDAIRVPSQNLPVSTGLFNER